MKLALRIRLWLGYRLLKVIGQFLALCIPSSTMRKQFRNWFGGPTKRVYQLRTLSDLEIEESDGVLVAVTQGIRFAHFDKSHESAIIVELFQGLYHFETHARTVVIDIGMNYGYATLYFASRDDVHAVYAFEPVPVLYERALFSCKINPQFADKIHAFNCGLGDSTREVNIDFAEARDDSTTTIANPPESRLATMRKHGSVKVAVQIKDAAVEIGDIIKRHPRDKIVMKCDCEGAEKEIFARLDEAGLLSAIDVVIMEYHFGYNQFIAPLLDKYGFVYFSNGGAMQGMIRAVKTA